MGFDEGERCSPGRDINEAWGSGAYERRIGGFGALWGTP